MDADAAHIRRYTSEERCEALRLYAKVGPSEAGRQLGIPSGTIRSWAQRNGEASVATGRRRAAVEAARLSYGQRRAELTTRLGEVAADLLERINEAKPGEVKSLAIAVAVCVDKAELLAGRATEAAESRYDTADFEAEVERLVAVLRS